MTSTMSNSAILLLYAGCFLCGLQTVTSSGPVFVNPAAQPQVNVAQTENAASLVTQTVYGFLDFTTTIGNTVMVFSPQSAAPVEAIKNTPPSENAVIDTKPTFAAVQIPISTTIKPSKTVQKQPEKVISEKPKISSLVQVQSNPPAVLSSKIQIAKSSPSRVEIFSSKIEVVGGHSVTPSAKIFTKVEVVSEPPSFSPVSSRIDIHKASAAHQSILVSSVPEVKDEEPALLGNNIGELEYDFLSRQPSEVVEETYKVINLKPSAKFHLKPRPIGGQTKNHPGPSHRKSGSAHPTGLVTKLGGTVVKDGSTTVHETSVIGTYISGKYAQVLQSTSHIVVNHGKPKLNPSPTLRILKTAAPTVGKPHKHHHHQLDPTPAGSLHEETHLPAESPANSNNLIKSTRRVSLGGGNFKQRFRNRKDQDVEEEEEESVSQQHHHSSFKKAPPRPIRPTQSARSLNEQTTVGSTTPAPGRRYQSSRRHKSRPNTVNTTPSADSSGGAYSRRGYKSRIHSSSVESSPSGSTSLYKFKLNRAPGRWQYKTTQKPRVTIRKQNGDGDGDSESSTTPLSLQDVSPLLNDVVTPQARSDEIDLNPLGSETSSANLNDDSAADNKLEQTFPLETIKVEISTPADFKNIYYELATIKSPYTFQVGSVKNTRYITVTSTFEKMLEQTESAGISATEPLTENILATSRNYDKDNGLDSGIATLPPLFLASDMATPPLETLTETFSTTQDMLKTHILPVVHGGNETVSLTLIQTYHVTRLVTATKTLPPMEAYQFVPSKILKDFNSHLDEAGSELHLELEFGDDNDQDGENHPRRSFPPDLNLANIGSDFDLSDVDKSKLPEGHLRLKKNQFPVSPKPVFPEPTPGLSPEQLQQLAILRLLNPGAAQVQVITTSKPVVKLETVYESHIIPIFNGVSTTLSTISRPLATVTKTEYEFGTSTIPGLPVPPIPQVNPLFPQAAQQQYTITSTPVVTQTYITQTDSKILKLTFGAKTAYTTILSTRVVPTVLTTYLTASVPVQPTAAAFPGYFPGPYPPYPFVG